MKKVVFISLMLLAGTIVFAQSENPARERKNERKERRIERQENHGETVSTVARETPAGPEKGEIVSGVASSKRQDGERARERKATREEKRTKGQDDVNRPDQPVRPERPARPERPVPQQRPPQGRPGGR